MGNGNHECPVGFAVVYRWRLKPGCEADFERGWRAVTERFLAHFGSLGSRLHRASDGTHVAYAQWPDRATREAADWTGVEADSAYALMTNSVLERFEPLELEPWVDRLARD